MNSKLSQWCDGLIEAGWLAAIISIPLFFNIHSDRVFEPDKITLLRSIAVIMTVAWLVKFVDQRSWQKLKEWLSPQRVESIWRIPFVLPVFLLVLSYLISTIFSVTPSVSLAGSYQRLQGTYSTFSYIVIFALMAATMRRRQQASRLVTFIIITSIPVAFYGLLQHFSLDPLPWGGDVSIRVAGHMGNAIFIGAYLIMAVPLTLARIIAAFNNILNDEELSSADVLRASVYIFTLAIQLITIYWSGSRGPWLGLFVGLFAFVLIVLVAVRNAASSSKRFNAMDALKAVGLIVVGGLVAYFMVASLLRAVTSSGRLTSFAGPIGSFAAFVVALAVPVLIIFVMAAARRGWRWLWLSWIVLALVVAVWLVAFNLPEEVTEPYAEMPVLGSAITTLGEWRELPNIGRFGQILEAEGGTGRVRTLIWGGALELILPHEPLDFPEGGSDTWNVLRPLIGYGPESMYVAYNRFYPPELATLEARNASPDRSHNETFDALVITGLLGFAIWQFLYISVFYYGFRWLGVLRSNRERNLLIGLWLGTGILVAVLFSLWRGTEYIGVAYPLGSIVGIVLYLIYYALFSSVPEEEDDPFSANRLLMAGLLAGVLAHYVEIHFGIAIAATRLYFFVFVGLMLVVGYVLPRVQETAVSIPARSKKRRSTQPVNEKTAVWGPAILSALMLALMLGVLGFTFTNFSPPPNVTFESAADLPVSQIFQQALFQNPGNDFSDSPFVFLMIILTWVLGTLVVVAEMVKSGEMIVPEDAMLSSQKRQIFGAFFLVIALVSIGLRLFLPEPEDAGATWMLGKSLLLLLALLYAYVGARFFLNLPAARLWGGIMAVVSILLTMPIWVAGGILPGMATAVIGIILFWQLWQPDWRSSLLPAGAIAFLSFAIGLTYTYLQASLLKASLFVIPRQQITTQADVLEHRIYEASQSATFLTLFYVFVFSLMFFAAFAASQWGRSRVKETGTIAGFASLAVLAVLGFIFVSTSNMNVIQADMIYKRAKPFDQQAGSQRDPDLWDIAIAIYDKAIDMTPAEDFYYLFLGRAFLERSTLAEDEAEQESLLNEAQERLKEAQNINPLNTDHTANLARLNTRWVELSQDEVDRETRLADAEAHYLDAMALSPQNSLIRNEYARLLLGLKQDCEGALGVYDDAIEIDPYFDEIYFGRADTQIFCAGDLPEAEREAAYDQAISDLKSGLDLNRGDAQTWLRVGQLNQDIGRFEEAILAYESARTESRGKSVPEWNIDYLISTVYAAQGNIEQAARYAEAAMLNAPPDSAQQIQGYLQSLTGQPVESMVEVAPEFVEGERPLATLPPAARNNFYNTPPPMVIDVNSTYDAIITTENGEMRLRLFAEEAPLAVNSFVFLANEGFYDGVTFHRVLEDFMAQGGDPTGSGGGGPGYQFANETDNDLSFDRPGILAMANAGPDTNGSQFFITFVPYQSLDGGYTIFGELIEGADVLNAITLRDPQQNPTVPGDTIVRIDIEEVVE